ncbi:MAG: heme-binding protein [Planctomycetota bacterium]
MRHTFMTLAAAALTLPAMSGAARAQADTPQDTASAKTATPADRIERLREPDGEDVQSRPGPEGPLYRAGGVFTDTKLPVGYPRPTPPGAIEIKRYPSVRQAEVSGEGSLNRSGRAGFMPLFRHIQSSGIAMTAPVEMRVEQGEDDAAKPGWTMAFLYHTPEDGPTGETGAVMVLDTLPVTVVSLGVQGVSDAGSASAMADELRGFLSEDGRWEPAGEIRVLGYSGPYVPDANKWWEVQIPVVPVAGDAAGTTGDDPL